VIAAYAIREHDRFLYAGLVYPEMGGVFWTRQSWPVGRTMFLFDSAWLLYDATIYVPELYNVIGGTESELPFRAQLWEGWDQEYVVDTPY
jgi:hypothetical protein